jgi:hypothetical protein
MFFGLFSGRFRQLMILFMNNVDFVLLVILNGFTKSRKSWKLARSHLWFRKRGNNRENGIVAQKRTRVPSRSPDTDTPQREEHCFASLLKTVSAIELAVTKYRGQRWIPCLCLMSIYDMQVLMCFSRRIKKFDTAPNLHSLQNQGVIPVQL